MLLVLLLRWGLLCLFLATASGVLLLEDINDPSSRRLILEDISLLLASYDVTGLCHPTSNEYAPVFPRCGSLPPPPQQKPRLLEDQYYNNDEDQDGNEEDQADDNQAQDNDDQKDDQDDDNLNADQKDYYDYSNYMMEDDDTRQDQYPAQEEMITKWFYVVQASLTIVCVIVGAMASGLYVGMLSLDPLMLVIKSRTAKTAKERKRLDGLLATIKRKHQLIVTLLIVNCVAAEAMPIFLQNMMATGVAIIASVVLVLIFGEILPAIIFTGSDQVEVACRLAPIVRMLMCLLYPLAYPIAVLLEFLSSGGVDNAATDDECHRGGTVYSRGELAALIRVQYEERRALRQQRKAAQQMNLVSSINDIEKNMSPTSSIDLRSAKREIHASLMSIDSHDVNMLEGALQLKTKTALDIYLSHHKVFCIPQDMVLDESNIFTIYASGYSRVPVFVDGDRRKIKGILMTRQLMVVKRNEQDPTPADLSLHIPRCVAPDTNLVELINIFQSGGRGSKTRPGHMAIVCARPHIGNAALEAGEALPDKAGLMGIITLEDVLEALLQDQIYDEMDGPGSEEQEAEATTTSVRRASMDLKPVDEMATIQESNSYHQMP